MATPLVVTIPHQLGQAEAQRRLREGLDGLKSRFAGTLLVQQEEWTGNRLAFRAGALGQRVNGTIEVLEDHVRLEVELPWLLARLAEKARGLVTQQGRLLLERK